jgi:hypothetical protein
VPAEQDHERDADAERELGREHRDGARAGELVLPVVDALRHLLLTIRFPLLGGVDLDRADALHDLDEEVHEADARLARPLGEPHDPPVDEVQDEDRGRDAEEDAGRHERRDLQGDREQHDHRRDGDEEVHEAEDDLPERRGVRVHALQELAAFLPLEDADGEPHQLVEDVQPREHLDAAGQPVLENPVAVRGEAARAPGEEDRAGGDPDEPRLTPLHEDVEHLLEEVDRDGVHDRLDADPDEEPDEGSPVALREPPGHAERAPEVRRGLLVAGRDVLRAARHAVPAPDAARIPGRRQASAPRGRSRSNHGIGRSPRID